VGVEPSKLVPVKVPPKHADHPSPPSTHPSTPKATDTNHVVCVCGAKLPRDLHVIKRHRDGGFCGKKFLICHRPQCLEIYPNRHSLELHQMTVHGQERLEAKMYHCHHPKCRKSFSSAALLSRHRLFGKHNSSRFKCPVCHKGFAEKLKMEYHRRTHFEERPEKCSFCAQSFKNPSTLRAHIKRVHDTAAKPFSCRKCGKRFFKGFLLKAHWKTHSDDAVTLKEQSMSSSVCSDDDGVMKKPFLCPYCPTGHGPKFTRWTSVRRHCRNLHPNEPLPANPTDPTNPRNPDTQSAGESTGNSGKVACDHCDQTFSTNGNMLRHLRRRHPDLVPSQPPYTAVCCVQATDTEVWKGHKCGEDVLCGG